MVKIALGAGHAINTAGKRSPDDEREWSFNNKVLLACQAKLKEYENVHILRLDDPTGKIDVPLTARTNKANNWRADVLISIHHNANSAKWGSWGGVETYTQPGSSKASVDIAKLIHPRIVKVMGLRDRGLKTKNLHITRESNMPAVLTEGGFMDSTTDIHSLRSDAKLKAQGEAIAEGIAAYFGLKSGASTSAKPQPSKKEEIPLADQKNAQASKSLEKEVALAKKAGITDGTFLHRTATREEVAAMNYRVYDKLKKEIENLKK